MMRQDRFTQQAQDDGYHACGLKPAALRAKEPPVSTGGAAL
jgi:hypothetical protein